MDVNIILSTRKSYREPDKVAYPDNNALPFIITYCKLLFKQVAWCEQREQVDVAYRLNTCFN